MFKKHDLIRKCNAGAQPDAEALYGCRNKDKDSMQAESGLSGVGRGCCCRIRRHHAHGAVRQRLLDIGLIANAEVEVMRVAPLGDPMELKVASFFATLRKRVADQIEIADN